MNRRIKKHPPKKGMVWSDKHRMWMDPDTRTRGRKRKDRVIAFRATTEMMRYYKHLARTTGISLSDVLRMVLNDGARSSKVRGSLKRH